MKWKNALRDKLPTHQEEVIISVKGVNYISKFCAENKHFEIGKESTSTVFKVGDHDIYWREIQNPNTPNNQTISL